MGLPPDCGVPRVVKLAKGQDMTPLMRRSLAGLPMTAMEIEAIHRLRIGDNSDLSRQIRRICESHERLRMELDGSATLIADDENRIASLTSQLSHALDAGLIHAKKLAEWRECLLRIFARAPDWSGECVQANIADMLGMTVAEVEKLTEVAS
jgi:hypothetical protein